MKSRRVLFSNRAVVVRCLHLLVAVLVSGMPLISEAHGNVAPEPVAHAVTGIVASPWRRIPGASEPSANSELIRLPGHVLPLLRTATPAPRTPLEDPPPLTLTLVLRRDDPAGFERYLHEVYDPGSNQYRIFLDQQQITERFGPSSEAYDALLSYLQGHGFELVQGSANRLTLTVRGSRIAAERAFNLNIGDYRLGERAFFANDKDPALPVSLAVHVQAVIGLSPLAVPQRSNDVADVLIDALRITFCIPIAAVWSVFGHIDYFTAFQTCFNGGNYADAEGANRNRVVGVNQKSLLTKVGLVGPADVKNWAGLDGSGQTVAVIAFDTFERDDVADFLAWSGFPATMMNNLHTVHVNGGATPGANQHEVKWTPDLRQGLKIERLTRTG